MIDKQFSPLMEMVIAKTKLPNFPLATVNQTQPKLNPNSIQTQHQATTAQAQEPIKLPTKKSPGVKFNPVKEPFIETVGNSPC
jgi:hypothetical protein